jgi:hypothetical protein
MIPVVVILIRVIGIQRTSRLIFKSNNHVENTSSDNLANARQVLRTLKIAVEQTFWKGNCLSRSIVLHGLLQRKGISSELRIGVRNKPKFQAHAWVEHRGTPLNAGSNVHRNYQLVDDFSLTRDTEFS